MEARYTSGAMIIGLTGMPGSGKSEVAKILEKRGFKALEMGNVIREEMKKRGIPMTNKNMRAFAIEFTQNRRTIVAQYMLRDIKMMKGRDFVISGVKRMEEVAYLKKHIPKKAGFVVVAVTAPEMVRYARMKARSRPDDPLKLADFRFRDRKELSMGLGSVIRNADYVLLNTGTIAELRKNVDRLLAALRQNDSHF
ncbi:MAG: AAA family ATPase [Candidatus Micrarchaeaceae archaeon]